MLTISFYGVRGSTPCSGDDVRRYGGNTSCVVVENGDQRPIIFDMGTGLRRYGCRIVEQGASFGGSILLTHLHWDHVQGLPFFGPIHRAGARLDVYGPLHDEGELSELWNGLMSPPYFPIEATDLGGAISFVDVGHSDFAIGEAKVRSRPVPHVGATNGYRVDWDGVSIAYVSDHQEPIDRPHHVHPGVLDLIDGADILIHDAQFTPDELRQRPDWGHCTVEYAVEVARQADVGQLVLFHHDPYHDDRAVDLMLGEAQDRAAVVPGLEVRAAAEGLVLVLDA